MARQIEMHWICSSCHQRNLGRHKKCQTCGDAKDASEKWLMPDDPGAAPSVTDPRLLAQARAGADWQCGYCGSHQRRTDGRCAKCGAAQGDGARVPAGGKTFSSHGMQPMAAHSGARRRSAPGAGARSKWGRGHDRVALVGASFFVLLGLLAGCCITVGALLPPPPPHSEKPEMVQATVAGGAWVHTVHVERYQVEDEQGFVEDRPEEAFDVRSLGQAHHHDEQVLDHHRTEHYTEQVPYQDTETYTAQESCGQDCTTDPPTCTEVCTPNDNGFASCSQSCSGGGTSCSTRYCSVTRTRQVTRYRSEPRTRQVPVYRSEPRYAERFAWHAWRWGHERDVSARGDDTQAPHWPSDAELAPPAALAEGERERTEREASYEVRLTTAPGRVINLRPTDTTEFQRALSHRRWHVAPDGSQLLKPADQFEARRPAP